MLAVQVICPSTVHCAVRAGFRRVGLTTEDLNILYDISIWVKYTHGVAGLVQRNPANKIPFPPTCGEHCGAGKFN